MKTLLIEPKKDHHSAASIQPFQRISYPLVLDVADGIDREADGIDREAVPTEAVLRRTERNSRHINFPESEMLQDFQQGTRMVTRGNDDNSGSIIAVRAII